MLRKVGMCMKKKSSSGAHKTRQNARRGWATRRPVRDRKGGEGRPSVKSRKRRQREAEDNSSLQKAPYKDLKAQGKGRGNKERGAERTRRLATMEA